MQKLKNKNPYDQFIKYWQIRHGHISEIEYNPWTKETLRKEYGSQGNLYKSETEAIAFLALQTANETKREILEKENKKWWQIWK